MQIHIIHITINSAKTKQCPGWMDGWMSHYITTFVPALRPSTMALDGLVDYTKGLFFTLGCLFTVI